MFSLQAVRVECPRIVYTDLDTSFCKVLAAILLARLAHPERRAADLRRAA
jgi:hypothetical protein